MKTITVMVAGNTSSIIENKVGSKKNWYNQYLSGLNCKIKFLDIYSNTFSYDDNDDGWIITGSECSAYDKSDWLDSFKKLLLKTINNNKPILGICFGHQLLVDVLRGQVIKNPKGWEVGYSSVSLTKLGIESPLFYDFPKVFDAAETHQDIVVKLPNECTKLAENKMGIQSFQYKNKVFGVQFHPEFNNQIMDAYIDMRNRNNIDVLYPQSKDISISHSIFNNFINLI